MSDIELTTNSISGMIQGAYNIYGVYVLLYSEDQKYYDFVEENYTVFKSQSVDFPRIDVFFSDNHGTCARFNKNELPRYGEGLYYGKDQLYWENEYGFSIMVDYSNSYHWKVFGYHFNLKEQLNTEEVYKNYMRCMRWMIHYPVFLLLDALKAKRLVHATALCKDNRAVILSGLNKVGKSSLGWYLFNKHDYQFMSDNFLFANGKHVYAFPEKARLSKESLQELGQTDYPEQQIYQKLHLPVDSEKIELKANPTHVFIVSNSQHLTIESIENIMALRLIESLHMYLKEFPEYSFYTLLDSLDLFQRSREPLFPEHTQFYNLSMPLDWSVKETANEVLRCISTT